jgi:hypothetical protein
VPVQGEGSVRLTDFLTDEIYRAWNAIGLEAIDPSMALHSGTFEVRLLNLAEDRLALMDEFLEQAPLTEEDKMKFANGNWERLTGPANTSPIDEAASKIGRA